MTPVVLGNQPSASPLPVGDAKVIRAAAAGGIVWPATQNFISINPANAQGSGGIGPFRKTSRFWLRACASIMGNTGVDWQRYDAQIKLVVNGSYGNDLNGIGFVQNANSMATTIYQGWQLSALFYCEVNTDYIVYIVSASSSPNVFSYQHPIHMNFYAYTIGEGVY